MTKQIQMPWLTAIIICASLSCGLTYLIGHRVGGNPGWWLMQIAWFIGPILCGFLLGALVLMRLFKGGGHPWALSLGVLFGVGTWLVWFYGVVNH
jgi:drug/metabolite transporter (DMT)-like permease